MTDLRMSPTIGPVERRAVLVSGPPGSGKSSLAAPLAEALGFALLSKDLVKETLWDALQPSAASRNWSRRIGGSAMEVLWALARWCPHVVLEANFRPHSDYERWRVTGLDARIVEVHCSCPLDVAKERFRQRARRPDHHPAHVDQAVTAEFLAEFDRPFGLWPVILVDTTQKVDIGALRSEVAAALDGPSAGSEVGDRQGWTANSPQRPVPTTVNWRPGSTAICWVPVGTPHCRRGSADNDVGGSAPSLLRSIS